MKRAALALLVTTASVSVVHAHHTKRPAVRPSAAGPSDTLRASRGAPRLPLRVTTPQHKHHAAPRPRVRVTRNGSSSLNWHGLALCESTDNPRAVDPTGTYFGLYQFDEETWYSVGGVGNPADASRAEQTFRARILYGQRGRAPWPVCGVHL